MQRTHVDRATVGAAWARRGYSCELWIDPPDRVWQNLQHETDLLLLLLEGSIQVELPDGAVRLEAGDEIHVPAHTRFTIRHVSREPARWLHGYRTNDAAAS